MEFYYKTPANSWIEGLPIGNGRLAAMLQETESADEITLNHERLWGGGSANRRAEENAEYLPFVRSFFKKGDYLKGAYLTNLFFAGKCGYRGVEGEKLNNYSMACEVDFKYICRKNEYIERRLDITSGVASIIRIIDGVKVKSEYFADCVSNKLCFCWKGDGKFSGELSLSRRPMKKFDSTERSDDANCQLKPIAVSSERIVLEGFLKPNIAFCNNMAYKTDGNVEFGNGSIIVNDATYIYAVVNITTSVDDSLVAEECTSDIPRDWNAQKQKHIDKFSGIMKRVDFELFDKESSLDLLTTDQRVARMKNGSNDNGVCEMYFNFGKYLMASSTICGDLPANLQGKWSNMSEPPWYSDYHYDINIQMNYWAAESLNMSEGVNGLIKFANSLIPKARDNAKRLYGCRGILIPLSSDTDGGYYGNYGWTPWIGAAAWLGQHLWWHYIYSNDTEYLKNEAYNFFRETAEFYEDYLEKDQNGVYQICPSYSPENPIDTQGNLPVGLCISCSCDIQLACDALSYAINSAEILGIDADKVEIWKELRDNLPEYKIGSDGRLMEWNEEFKEREAGHRHLSHLYGVYPSNLFTPERNVKEYNAAIKSLEYRMSHGGGHTGWSRAWCACIFARLKRAKEFYEHYTALIKDFAASTLLDLHPPKIFQIDGNFGGVAATIEALVGYYDDKAHLLSALPESWKNGRICGIKIPNGHIISVYWKDGALQKAEIKFGFKKELTLCYSGKQITVQGNTGEVKEIIF